MATEKLGKAYFWRSGTSPKRTHAVFVKFLQRLGTAPKSERDHIANVFSFGRFREFQSWVTNALPLAYDLERLAPDLAGDGPNPEYPWPTDEPQYVPAEFDFGVWNQLKNTGKGRQFIHLIQAAVERFPDYA